MPPMLSKRFSQNLGAKIQQRAVSLQIIAMAPRVVVQDMRHNRIREAKRR